jgi:eukaryotic-like serine/threonine-protein kinase
VNARWNEVRRLFVSALELSPGERDTFLERSCGGDDVLRRELRGLLDAHEMLATRDAAVPGAPNEIDAARALALLDAGRTIGPYRIVREVGRGGMGTVYLAERDDQFRKRVAIKVLSRAWESHHTLRRFVEERQILASLEHPNIARLLDGGVAPDGVPYYVLEYVEGSAIDRYCDAHRLTIDERVALFERVCDAVQYAHRNLVIHRDLKPGNILVSEDGGQVKLLDFGIAKVLGSGVAESTLTRPGAAPMTPEYASPEQILGGAVSTASDIYSLGVVLYRLLTGQHPYPQVAGGPNDVAHHVIAAEAERPSVSLGRPPVTERERRDAAPTITEIARTRNTTPERLRRRLAGDLDNIILRALRKEPERRYATVEQLVADLDRHRRGLPVYARPDTWGYRTQKFVRRHRVGVASAVIVTLLSVGFGIVTALQSGRIARERDKAEQVAGFLTALFAISDPGMARGRAVTARELLDQGARRIDEELARQPAARAQMMDAMGRAYLGLGLYDEARRLLESALALRRSIDGPTHPDVAALLFQLAYLRRLEGEFELAATLYRESLAIRRQRLGNDHPDVIDGINGLAFLLRGTGDFVQAESLYRDALGRSRRTFRSPHVILGHTLNGLGASLFGQAKHAESEPYFREALAVYRAVHPEDHPDVDIALYNLATALHGEDRLQDAEPLYRDVLERSRRTLGSEHPLFAIGLVGLGDVLRDAGKYVEAETLLREALKIQRKTLPPRSERTATTLVGLGGVLVDLDRAREGESLLREALAIREAKLAGHWHTGQARSELGAALSALGRQSEAESLLVRGFEEMRAIRGLADRETRAALALLGRHRARVERAK